MKVEDWHAVLASEPATPNQRGAIMREFGRLGFGEEDRAARLAACMALVGLDELDTTGDLTMGQAGQLVGILAGFADRNELDAATGAGEDRPAPARTLTLMAAAIAAGLPAEPPWIAARRLADQPGTHSAGRPR